MPEAGWLLLLLFLGVCSLIVVALLWPSFAQAVHQSSHNRKSTGSSQQTASSDGPETVSEPLGEAKETDWLSVLSSSLHLLVIGHSRGGKTTIIHELAIRWAAARHHVVVCDLDAAPGLWNGCVVYGCGNDSQAVNKGLEEVKAEVGHRRSLRGSGRQRRFSPLYLVIDEYQEVGRSIHCPQARGLIEDILRRGGKLDVHLLLGVQDKQVKTMGFEGQGDLRRNFSFIVEVRCDSSGTRSATIAEGSDETTRQTHSVPVLADLDQLVARSMEMSQSVFPTPVPSSPISTSSQAPNFSPGEIAVIAAAISQGTLSKTEIVKAMPGYSTRRHRMFATFYDQLEQALTSARGTREAPVRGNAFKLSATGSRGEPSLNAHTEQSDPLAGSVQSQLPS